MLARSLDGHMNHIQGFASKFSCKFCWHILTLGSFVCIFHLHSNLNCIQLNSRVDYFFMFNGDRFDLFIELISLW